MTVESVKLFADKWQKKARRRNKNILISAEALYRHLLDKGTYDERRISYLKRVAEVFCNFDITVILVFRRPDDYLRSLYQERVMRAIRPLPAFEKFISNNQRGLGYYENAKLFADIFPQVNCLIYEELADTGSFFINFFKELHVDVSHFREAGIVRKSMSPQETMVKNFANNYINSRKAGKSFLRWLRSKEASDRINEVYGDTDYDLWPSHAARKEFLKTREGDVEKLRSAFFPDRETLFPPLKEGDTLSPVPPLPKELKQLVFEYFGRKTE